jgi:putative membrane protein
MTGEGGDAFLGTQGYIWDTQSDMLYATIGSVCALVFMSKFQNKYLEKLNH